MNTVHSTMEGAILADGAFAGPQLSKLLSELT